MEPTPASLSNEDATNKQMLEALAALDELTPVDHSKDKTRFEALTDRWATRSMLCKRPAKAS